VIGRIAVLDRSTGSCPTSRAHFALFGLPSVAVSTGVVTAGRKSSAIEFLLNRRPVSMKPARMRGAFHDRLLFPAPSRERCQSEAERAIFQPPEMPQVFHVNFLEGAAEPDVAFGSKAVGEPSLMRAFGDRRPVDLPTAPAVDTVVHP
jgi:hypothetical protein